MMMPQILSDRYRMIRALSAGGFGETFLAEDIKMPSGRRCVIKRLKPITDNPEIYQSVKERFQREAAILEELGEGSSQIPKLYAYFEEEGNFYLVQEFIEGVTLNSYLHNQGNISESSVREILLGLLPILDFVHSRKIVHRDIKPENIILRNSDHKPVLIDFGAVRESMGTMINSQGNTTGSIVIGTPGFMSAEQGCGRPVYASDLYSLGLTAIYLLTGKLPQELKSDPLAGEIIWRPYALQVSPTLAGVLDKAIHPTARDRYATAREMLEVLKTSPDNVISSSGILPTVMSVPVNNLSSGTPTVFSKYPASSQSPPTIISSSGVHNNSTVVNNGMNDWYKAMIMGSLIGGFILAGLFILKPSGQVIVTPTPTTPESASPSPSSIPDSPSPPTSVEVAIPTPSPTPETVSTYTPPPQSSITQVDAVNLISSWLQAKQKIFSPPFNRSLAEQLTTDILYYDITKPGGSLDWLSSNNAFYRFGVQKVESVSQFVANGDRATLVVEVTEDRTFYVNGKIDPAQTDFRTRQITYTLRMENGRWKIADYKS